MNSYQKLKAENTLLKQHLITVCIETVLDNTCGSGTTCLGTLKTNRNFIGIEKDHTYFEIAQKRIQPYINKTTMF